MAPPLDDATHADARVLLRDATAVPVRTPLVAPQVRQQTSLLISPQISRSQPQLPSEVPPGPPAPGLRASLVDSISGRVIAALSGAWFLLMMISAAQAPPDGSHPTLPAWAAAMNVVADLALLGTIVGFAVRQRWSLLTSTASAGLWTVAVLACPLVDHHETLGAAWGGALITSAALTAASAALFARGRTSRPRAS